MTTPFSQDELTETLLAAKRTGNFFSVLLGEAPREAEARTEFCEVLAAIHNANTIDLVAEFAEFRNGAGGADFFLTRHLFQTALPYLDAPTARVVSTVAHLVTQAGQDLASHWPLEQFHAFLTKSPERPKEALRSIEEDPSSLAFLLPVVATAGFRSQRDYFTEQLLRLSKSPLEELQRQAVFSLGEAPWRENDGEVPPQVVNQLESLVAGTESDGLLAASVSAVLALLPKDQASSDRFLEIIRAARAKGGQWTLGAFAQAYAFKKDALAPAFLTLLTNYLKANVTQNAQVLQWVDFGVSSRLHTTDRNEALEILEEVLRRFPGSIEIKSFGCCESSIGSSPQVRSFIVTRWLASGEAALCDAAGDLVQRSHRDDVTIDADRDALATVDEAALAFVAIKAVGYLFFSHMAAASFLISLMRIGAIEPIKELLLGSLLINYPGSLRTFVEARITSEREPVAAALRDCLAQLDRYLKNIETAMGIKELRASAEQRATFHKTLTQKLSKSFEAAQKEMPLLSLVKRSIVLYGRGSVQRVVHADGTTHRADMMFKTQGTEFSFPRMSHIDELGLHLQLRIFRVGKRNQ